MAKISHKPNTAGSTVTDQPAQTLVTHHVFLDTEVYRQLGHNPDNPLLRTLSERVTANGLQLHITDITFWEIKRQLTEFVGKAAQAVLTAKKQAGRWRHRHPEIVTQEIAEIDITGVSQAAFNKLWLAARTEWRAIHHEASKVPAQKVFADYFSRFPPFEKEGSKEFPDAFVIKCLQRWCTAHKETMYVVTADQAMSDAAAKTGVLFPIKRLDDLLALAAARETPGIRSATSLILKKNRIVKELQSAIDSNIGDLIPIYVGDEYAEGEVTGHRVSGDVEVEDFEVVAASDREITVVAQIRVPLTIEIEYEDRSSAIYDREDDLYFGTDIEETEIEDDPLIRVFLKLRRRPAKIVDLRIMTGEVEVNEPYNDYK